MLLFVLLLVSNLYVGLLALLLLDIDMYLYLYLFQVFYMPVYGPCIGLVCKYKTLLVIFTDMYIFFYPIAKVYTPIFKLRPCSLCYKTGQTIPIMYVIFSRKDALDLSFGQPNLVPSFQIVTTSKQEVFQVF